ncbi:hypothetical protein GCM10008179_00030 [Hansschlegelia plantiphila]|uniref:Formaldehyde-activating enzyme domain-containing protein n=1 Tax=Hansschlegelia plantiphila TaxID=374655 RepID=A0A9W6IZ94_9HYPH|nr:hypothetical protein GCM10008179_00030 [Hansschlegelia plantiphila]
MTARRGPVTRMSYDCPRNISADGLARACNHIWYERPNIAGLASCGAGSLLERTTMAKITKTLIGESLVGDGNEVAHIDLIIGPRGSTAESAFCSTSR